ncbi:MAG: peptidyl-prolyl cis-trans isomerase [Deltaproteobacteria bacterium]|nr:peptidyl-prolyl cis-trans isomerase [Deltaproteobacteria bacterium]
MATFVGGQVTRAEFDRESKRLPPLLRPQFDTIHGKHELAVSLVDKKLLVQHAKEQGYAADPELRRQVDELEERLLVQAMMQHEEKALPPATEADERAYYEAHKLELAEPERVKLARVQVNVPDKATAPEKAKARARIDKLHAQLQAGVPLAKVAPQGDGPEKARGGELGVFAKGELNDRDLERAAFALKKPGDLSPVTESREGLAVVVLLEKKPSRLAPFEELRQSIHDKLELIRKRKAFDELRERLRKKANVHIDDKALQ